MIKNYKQNIYNDPEYSCIDNLFNEVFKPDEKYNFDIY